VYLGPHGELPLNFVARLSLVFCFIGVLLGVAFRATQSRACQCVVDPNGGSFVPGADVVVPSNFKGLSWWGPATWSGRFTVEVRRDSMWLPVPFAFEDTLAVESPASRPHGERLSLIRLVRSPAPGEHYRFQAFGWHTDSREITIGSDSWKADSTDARLVVDSASVGPITAESRGGSCKSTVPATQVRVHLIFPARMRSLAAALMYSVTVDGHPWRPNRSLCDPTPLGTSWVGAGSELFFTQCFDPQARESGHPSDNLSAGTHAVRFAAWLPGTPERIVREAEIRLVCPSSDPGGE
jgi:hypothetical protein